MGEVPVIGSLIEILAAANQQKWFAAVFLCEKMLYKSSKICKKSFAAVNYSFEHHI